MRFFFLTFLLAVTGGLSAKSQCSATVTKLPANCQSRWGYARIDIKGEGPFQVVWPDGKIAQERADLAPGTYQVQYSNNKGCKNKVLVKIESMVPLQITARFEGATAPEARDGWMEIDPGGGEPPFKADWKFLDDTLQVFNTALKQRNLLPGRYKVTVTDVNGCFNDNEFTLDVRKK